MASESEPTQFFKTKVEWFHGTNTGEGAAYFSLTRVLLYIVPREVSIPIVELLEQAGSTTCYHCLISRS